MAQGKTMKCSVFILVSCFLFAGCATTRLPPATRGGVVFEEDEKRLWLRSEEEQEVINESGHIYQDEKLESYLNHVLKILEPPETGRYIQFKVMVIKSHLLNAFAFPNGVIYVHTGMLARMENEAQLATLLAHEMTHCTHRHAVKQFRHIKNATAFLATVQVTLGSVGFGDVATLIGAVGAMAAVTGYSREYETEADMEGIKRVIDAGYDPFEAPKLFIYLKEELEEEERKEPFFFGTHPRLVERIENYETFLKNHYPRQIGGLKKTDAFVEKIKEVVLINAVLDLKAGRFKVAQRGAEKYLNIQPNDARAYHLLGEVFRQKGEEGDSEKAEQYYKKAISLNPAYPAPYKAVGLIHYKDGERDMAKKYLELYLSISPKAIDRMYIEEYLRDCDKGVKKK